MPPKKQIQVPIPAQQPNLTTTEIGLRLPVKKGSTQPKSEIEKDDLSDLLEGLDDVLEHLNNQKGGE